MESEQQDYTKILDYIKEHFYGEYLEGLKEFVRIPSLSPPYDKEWRENQFLFKQCDHLVNFVKSQDLKGVTITPLKDEGYTPFLIVDVKATDENNKNDVLLYGHMDKQPFGEGWKYSPTDPVIENGRLWGRGSSDDGYSLFSAVLAIKACQDNGYPHPRCIITIEGAEESGDISDLLYYLETYKEMIGQPKVVICLDSDAYREDTLVINSSLRGNIRFDIEVNCYGENLHSGYAGIVPDPYFIAHSILSRIYDYKTQTVSDAFNVEIPEARIEECKYCAKMLPKMSTMFENVEGLKSRAWNEGEDENFKLILWSTWYPQLTVTGQEGLPSIVDSANSIKKSYTLRCSLRIPPTLTNERAAQILKEKLDYADDSTYGAKVNIRILEGGNGLNTKPLDDNVQNAFFNANKYVFEGNTPLFIGCNASIPFMSAFGGLYPSANILLTGVGFPNSNAHAANENLDLEFCRKLVSVIAITLAKL